MAVQRSKLRPKNASDSKPESQKRVRNNGWFANNPSKAYYEKFSLIWAPASMFVLLVLVLGTPLYKYCDKNSYLAITLIGCLPGFVLPVLFPCDADRGKPYSQRFWVKGTIWIAIFGFYGNYFWTHYFYQLLGAKYLFDSYRINDVPVVCFTSTFFYFTFYFSFSNLLLRRLATSIAHLPRYAQSIIWWTNILVLSYVTAVFEAVSIEHFPLYTFDDRESFVTIGSMFYALYFVVGFPMFFALDEYEQEKADATIARNITLQETAVNACGAAAIVTVLLDVWRLTLGSLEQLGSGMTSRLPFVYQSNTTDTICQVSPEHVITMSECAEVAKGWANDQFTKVASSVQHGLAQLDQAISSGWLGYWH
ncbi:Cycloeucalenol cycloisomerase [Gracilariopsis chorda]|uniref:Cycloeucalenol cycloisomerase n=1 Tax=Gracilariopsis chorda TaxID=448386 RepID=A0A2V3IN65_9FLOR|nr:Cycloeucalenol cycloisomerase [Gracilariopsis chorda]|eukprot:PXF42560.1 Cycloeucalenol cycloisomerase [Gracilariopsis chorda]